MLGSAPICPSLRDASRARSVLLTVDQLEAHVPAWENLAAHALEPNVFHEPWMLLPAARFLPPTAPLRFLLVYASAPGCPQSWLCGLFPLLLPGKVSGLPLTAASLWQHDHCFLGTPLVREGTARLVLDAFLLMLRSHPGNGFVELSGLSGDGPVYSALVELLDQQRRPRFEHAVYHRPLLRLRSSSDEYLSEAMSSHSRRRLARRERELTRLGTLQYRHLAPDDALDPWLDTFLELEASGWKGRAGTALACRPTERDYFRTIAREAFVRGQLEMRALRVGERTVAVDCNFLSGRHAFAFKIAHDEQFARASPGILLEVHNIRELHARGSIDEMDSCCSPEPSALDSLWLDRQRITSVLIGNRGPIAPLVVRALPVVRRVWRGLRRWRR